MADALHQGRSAVARQAWADAHERLSAADQAAPLEPEPEVFLLQVAALGPEDEAPPDRLRAKALEIPAEPG